LKNGREQVEIVALYEELGSYRAVATLVGCDHKTVKRYVEFAGGLGQLAPTRQRARVTDEYRYLVRERVEQSRGRITARRLLRLLRAAGYQGSERSLRRAVAEEKRAFGEREARAAACSGRGARVRGSGCCATGARRARWIRRRGRGRCRSSARCSAIRGTAS
jgi:hypothetical protein